MPEFPINRFGRQLWEAAERSQVAKELAEFVRSLGETGGITIEKAATNGLNKSGQTVHPDMVILSDAIKQMRKKGGNGNNGAPAQIGVWKPQVINFPTIIKKSDIPVKRVPDLPYKPVKKYFPGKGIPPENPTSRRFPGLDEEDGGLGPVGVILPPKFPKNPPLKAAALVPAN